MVQGGRPVLRGLDSGAQLQLGAIWRRAASQVRLVQERKATERSSGRVVTVVVVVGANQSATPAVH